MTDLAELVDELFPGAPRTAARDDGAGRERARQIAWVRVMRARVPAFDALEPGDVVVVPASALAVVAPGPGELGELVAALASVPISGAILAEAEAGDGGDPGLDRAAAVLGEAGIGSVRVHRVHPPAVERSVIGFIVGRGAGRERPAAPLGGEPR